MGTTTTDQAATDGDAAAATARSTRDRILDAATDLFYAHGIRAISADKVIERASITKVTFYRHFPAKDDLVVAYLQRQGTWERGSLDGVRSASLDAAEAFRLFARGIGTEACKPGFRGCAFINAAAEYAEPDSEVRKLVVEHRAWYRRTFAAMLEQMDVADAEQAAEEVMMLRDGAMLAGYLGEPTLVGSALERGIFAVIETRKAQA